MLVWLLMPLLIWCIFANIHKANWSQLTVNGLKYIVADVFVVVIDAAAAADDDDAVAVAAAA